MFYDAIYLGHENKHVENQQQAVMWRAKWRTPYDSSMFLDKKLVSLNRCLGGTDALYSVFGRKCSSRCRLTARCARRPAWVGPPARCLPLPRMVWIMLNKRCLCWQSCRSVSVIGCHLYFIRWPDGCWFECLLQWQPPPELFLSNDCL